MRPAQVRGGRPGRYFHAAAAAGVTAVMLFSAVGVLLVVPAPSFATAPPSPQNAKEAPVANFTNPNPQYRGEFGVSVSIGGDIAAVGAPGETAGGASGAGRAYVFNLTSGALISALASPEPQPGGHFGTSVSVGNGFVVVGAPDENATGLVNNGECEALFLSQEGAFGVIQGAGPPQCDSGNAYVFNAADGALVRTLTSPNAQPHGYFGESVSASGSFVVVGAPGETAGGMTNSTECIALSSVGELAGPYCDSGDAYVFNVSTGALVSTLASANENPGGRFGASASVKGDVVVIGAPDETINGFGGYNAGRAYVFNATTGALVRTLVTPNFITSGHFGGSVSVSGAMVVVGAPDEYNNGGGSYGAGNAYLFNLTTGATKILTSPYADENSYGHFGTSVSASGDFVVVGAKGEGRAYVYDSTTGDLVRTIASPRPQAHGFLGDSVSADGRIVIVGAYGEASGGQDLAGNAYVFEITQPPTVTVSVTDLQGNPATRFQEGGLVHVELTLSTSSSASFIGVVEVTDKGTNGTVFFASQSESEVVGAVTIDFTFTVPNDAASGAYVATGFVWNGFVSTEGANWRALAQPQSTTFSVS